MLARMGAIGWILHLQSLRSEVAEADIFQTLFRWSKALHWTPRPAPQHVCHTVREVRRAWLAGYEDVLTAVEQAVAKM